jgi:hypothetical protein
MPVQPLTSQKQEAVVQGLEHTLMDRKSPLVFELPLSLDIELLVVDMQGVVVDLHPTHERELEQGPMQVHLLLLDLMACITYWRGLKHFSLLFELYYTTLTFLRRNIHIAGTKKCTRKQRYQSGWFPTNCRLAAVHHPNS